MTGANCLSLLTYLLLGDILRPVKYSRKYSFALPSIFLSNLFIQPLTNSGAGGKDTQSRCTIKTNSVNAWFRLLQNRTSGNEMVVGC